MNNGGVEAMDLIKNSRSEIGQGSGEPTNPEDEDDYEYNFGYRKRFPWMSSGVEYPWEPWEELYRSRYGLKNSEPITEIVIESQRSSCPVTGYCAICCASTDHDEFDCPRREEATGTFCMYCYGPCQNEWKGKHGKLILKGVVKSCILCDAEADHWAVDCPLLLEPDPKTEPVINDYGF